ncbi:hypothetical protein F511_43799 [Dorcoceras hygrometricum]|uniref:Uncharacterized protein n=1 Tax=Dorcoceras hygrometricum TaxID=472368 RepID=A0A2Z7CW53_9LAMI|nr:hypothetical protein F511_43799 [Dorcoceras hygrometricum]
MHINSWSTVAHVWMYCFLHLDVLLLASGCTVACSLLIDDITADFIIADPALALLFSTADCDDITADVIIADSRSCALVNC